MTARRCRSIVCFILRDGSDVTVVTWGAMTIETLRAAATSSTSAGSAPR